MLENYPVELARMKAELLEALKAVVVAYGTMGEQMGWVKWTLRLEG